MKIVLFIFLTFCISTQSIGSQSNFSIDTTGQSTPYDNHKTNPDIEIEDTDDFEEDALELTLIEPNRELISIKPNKGNLLYNSPYLERLIRPPRA